jgi:hypothetical protein
MALGPMMDTMPVLRHIGALRHQPKAPDLSAPQPRVISHTKQAKARRSKRRAVKQARRQNRSR